MPFSVARSNALLNQEVKGKYMGLFAAAPTDDGAHVTFAELAYTGYARAHLSEPMADATGRSITNNAIIFFPEAESTGGTATHFGLFSAKTGGEPTIYGALDAPVTIPVNYVPLFRVEQFQMTLT